MIWVELLGHVAEWLRRGLQILASATLIYIISPLINLFAFNLDFKLPHGSLVGHRDTKGLKARRPSAFP